MGNNRRIRKTFQKADFHYFGKNVSVREEKSTVLDKNECVLHSREYASDLEASSGSSSLVCVSNHSDRDFFSTDSLVDVNSPRESDGFSHSKDEDILTAVGTIDSSIL